MTAPVAPGVLDRVIAAVSREGKPRGDHMIEAYSMMANVARTATRKPDREMAEVFDCASRCIANETAMFMGAVEVMVEVVHALREANGIMLEMASALEAEVQSRREGELPRRIARDLEVVEEARAFVKKLAEPA